MSAANSSPQPAVQGEDPLGKLKSHMTDVMTPHQFSVFSGQYAQSLSEREVTSLAEIELALQKMPPDSVEALLSAFIGHLSTCKNPAQVEFFFSLLPKLVTKQVLSAKTLCTSLIVNLQFDEELVWCESLETLKRQIGAVDYKGCRDLLRTLLNKISTLPFHMARSAHHRVSKTVAAVEHILSRDTCLLPAYMAQTEIAVSYKGLAHWIICLVLKNFRESFKPLTHTIYIPGRRFMLPVISTSCSHNFLWKVDSTSLAFPCKGALPFEDEVQAAQPELLIRVIRQPCSRDLLMHMLSLEKKPKKQPQPVLEELLATAVIRLMEDAEQISSSEDTTPGQDAGSNEQKLQWSAIHSQWYYVCCLLTYFGLHGFVSIPDFVAVLKKKIPSVRNCKACRDDLMWLLLQIIGNTLSRNVDNAEDMCLCVDIFDELYREEEPLPVPDSNDPLAGKKMAAACLMFQLLQKLPGCFVAEELSSNLDLQRNALEHQIVPRTVKFNSYHGAVCLNAAALQHAVHKSLTTRLGEALMGAPSVYSHPPTGMQPTRPCSMAFLDALTVHVKMSMLLHIATVINKHSVQFQRGLPPSPAMLGTYSRLLHSFETESYGIKNFQSNVLPTAVRQRSLPTLNALTEVLAFHVRLHHLQPHYRTGLLVHFHQDSNVASNNSCQLYLNAECASLRLIASCACADMHKEFGRLGAEIKLLLISGAEELNRSIVLTIARGLYVSGCDRHASAWVEVIMKTLQNSMDALWPSQVVKCIPKSLQDYFPLCTASRPKQEIVEQVDKEWSGFQAMSVEAAVSHFTQPASNTFFCLMWKQLLDTGHLSAVCLRVLESLTSQQLACHIRTFCDYLVGIHSQRQQQAMQTQLVKGIAAVSDLIWKYDVLPLDKLILTMVMRNHDTPQARVGFYIIQLLLLKDTEFRNRVNSFVKEVSPQFWLAEDSYQEHQEYLKTFPENFHYERLARSVGEPSRGDTSLKVYLGNVCLRFLPVFDLLIHRMLEMVSVLEKSLITMLDHLGALYKFHDQPVLFLYSTLHYYQSTLSAWPQLKKKMVAAVIGAQNGSRPKGWCLSQQYQAYLAKPEVAVLGCWVPGADYYAALLQKLVNTFNGTGYGFPNLDWRFMEFSNATDLAVHATCLELLALPCTGDRIVTDLLEAMIANVMVVTDEKTVLSWINAVASLLVMLPESFWGVLMARIVDFIRGMADEELKEQQQSEGTELPEEEEDTSQLGRGVKVTLLGWEKSNKRIVKRWCICLTMARAFWHHSTIGQISGLPDVIRQRMKPVVTTERQLLFVLQMVGPSLHRMNEERTRCLVDLVVVIHGMLKNVDENSKHLEYLDMICDYLYHLKYMFVGEYSKAKLQDVFDDLRPALKARLRFMMSSGSAQGQS